MQYAEVFYKRRRKKCSLAIQSVAAFLYIAQILPLSSAMPRDEISSLRGKAKEMFFHAYDSYMNNAFPADELMPLSCKGRYRGTEPSRGDIDDALGNYTLTLVDTLDTLFIMNETEKFETAVRNVIRTVNFKSDIVVSVFEVIIRVLGGLLGGHVGAIELKTKGLRMAWYKDELLHLAEDLGKRLLPAFNTSTGIPYPRVNLQHGLDRLDRNEQATCTACAGSMILEFAALSRMTGDPVYEQKANHALNALWDKRNVASNLMGTVINVHNGDWLRREAGVGAGIDSYYEYLFKAYVLLGETHYLERFNLHYEAIMKYVKVLLPFPLLVDVLMHRPFTRAKSFMDALLAFWPGLQVMTGDLKPAITLHEILYQVVQRHSFLPEAFTTDFSVHWGQHPLRPEFIESTYFLYKATRDPYYLHIGAQVMKNLEQHARVPCGYAAISDVRTMKHEDQLDSFVLAETFKYLYLLFTDAADLPVNLDRFVFTTEAHLLPLSLAHRKARRKKKQEKKKEADTRKTAIGPEAAFCPREVGPSGRTTCPNLGLEERLVGRPMVPLAHQLRLPLRDTVRRFQPTPLPPDEVPGANGGDIGGTQAPLLRAEDFQFDNPSHIAIIKRLGIQLVEGSEGRMHQLVHNPSLAENERLGSDGVKFMTDMIRLTQQTGSNQGGTSVGSVSLRYVQLVGVPHLGGTWFKAGPAQFGPTLNELGLRGRVAQADPLEACTTFEGAAAAKVRGRIVLVRRGGCMFIEKARFLQAAGVIGAVVMDNKADTSSDTHGLFAMSGDGQDDVKIPMVFVFAKEGNALLHELFLHGNKLEFLLSSRLQDQGEIIRRVVNSYLDSKGERKASSSSPTTDLPFEESDSTTGGGKVAQSLLFTPKNSAQDGLPWVQLIEVTPERDFQLRVLYNPTLQQVHGNSGSNPSAAESDALWQAVERLILLRTNMNELPSRRFYLDYLRLLFVHSESGLPIASNVLKVPVQRVLARLANVLVSDRVMSPEQQGLSLTEAEEKYFLGLELRYEHADSVPVVVATSATDKLSKEKLEMKVEADGPIVKEFYNGEEKKSNEEP